MRKRSSSCGKGGRKDFTVTEGALVGSISGDPEKRSEGVDSETRLGKGGQSGVLAECVLASESTTREDSSSQLGPLAWHLMRARTSSMNWRPIGNSKLECHSCDSLISSSHPTAFSHLCSLVRHQGLGP